MTEEERNRVIATFRYGVIADLVDAKTTAYGDRKKLILEKANRDYNIPYSSRYRIGAATISAWLRAYRAAGNRLEGLFPKPRSDKGTFRRLDPEVRLAIKQILAQEPRLTVPVIIRRLVKQGSIDHEVQVTAANVYRFIEKGDLRNAPSEQEDRRQFEAVAPNDLWQSDVMHGPRVWVSGQKKKTYLIGILDDHSRMLMHCQFYLAENLECFLKALQDSVARRGLPRKLYVDNGACYRANHLEFVSAALGISLVHARPYRPQGKGKIERFFRTVRMDFLPETTDLTKLDELNQALEKWLEGYHHRPHKSTTATPYDRYRKGLECIRSAPSDLMEYFRCVERRLVRKDRTVQLHSKAFEVPTELVDKRVELRFHYHAPEFIEVFYENKSYGQAVPSDKAVNIGVRRDWQKPSSPNQEPLPKPESPPGGSLFSGEEK